ncbi:septal ring lytic transglycosylase RlpA [Photobacterium aquimaris]|uniref:Endolytic peptidoglycan transglycosylase RlpA n=1 Tax=Photobacterium aquimaris TaxID=512643 RepID=A0A2T3IF80_9GAMM|nr:MULTISPECIES: septal ring lytic transglycosylase RlpA family protein [Photobacterium]PSU24595.1 septal ring lytic transglycosylase RlpA [Photobacterium aquimaris]PSV97660.1 septal ring lytic transglycosylase RlpA [Photobacterium aquimaris]
MRSLFVIFFLILAGCSSSPEQTQQPQTKPNTTTKPAQVVKPNTDDPNAGRYSLKDDRAPKVIPDFSKVQLITPHYEPYSRGGNKDYTLRGKRYHIIKNPQGYTETGFASWYGEKFHGHKTANGEVYNMFAMTAAHKTLPLPSFVRVTNTLNHKSVIVRVNDRGPFHDGRIIDLSMAAASKLGVISYGTAPVKIEVITVPKPSTKAEIKKAPIPIQYFIQLAAVNNQHKADQMQREVKQRYSTSVDVEKIADRAIFRVRLGPFLDHKDAELLLKQVKIKHYPQAFMITEKR